MEATATIESVKTNFGMVSTWKGRGKVAVLYLENIVSASNFQYHRHDLHAGAIIEYGRLKLRILGHDMISTRVWVGLARSPHTDLYWLYRQKIESFLRFLYRCERAVNGFMMKPLDPRYSQGFTEHLADKLL